MDNLISGDAIAIHYATEVILENNDIRGVPGSGKIDAIDCDGILKGVFRRNSIYDFPDDAIDIGTGSSDILIEKNFISNLKGSVWRLKVAAYGLNDAARDCYRKLKNLLAEPDPAPWRHDLQQQS